MAEALVTASFSAFGESVTVTPRGGDPVAAFAIIERGAEVLDDYGVLVDSRIEIEVRNSETGKLSRGSTVVAGVDTFQLLEPITDNGITARWVASEV